MRAALIGLGRMGMRHLQILRELELPVVGICDSSSEARGKAAAAFTVSDNAVFNDVGDMLSKSQPDLVVVATTAPSHEGLVCSAAKAGARAILCEKPMAVSVAACDRMESICRSTGTRLAVNHQMRFMEQYTKAREIVQDETFGGLSSVTVVAGNFGLAMNGSHYFEMFRYVSDDEPATVSAWFSPAKVPNPRGPQFEDRAGCVRVVARDGCRFYMDASSDQGHGMHVTYAGPNGRLDIDELAGHARLVVRKEEHRQEPTTRYGMPWHESTFTITPADSVAPSRAVLSALIEGKNYPDGGVGGLAVKVLAAAYTSDERQGAAIAISSDVIPRDHVFPWA